MAIQRRTVECFPNDGTDAIFDMFDAPKRAYLEPNHEACKGGESYVGVIDGWYCPCECHRKTVTVSGVIKDLPTVDQREPTIKPEGAIYMDDPNVRLIPLHPSFATIIVFIAIQLPYNDGSRNSVVLGAYTDQVHAEACIYRHQKSMGYNVDCEIVEWVLDGTEVTNGVDAPPRGTTPETGG